MPDLVVALQRMVRARQDDLAAWELELAELAPIVELFAEPSAGSVGA